MSKAPHVVTGHHIPGYLSVIPCVQGVAWGAPDGCRTRQEGLRSSLSSGRTIENSAFGAQGGFSLAREIKPTTEDFVGKTSPVTCCCHGELEGRCCRPSAGGHASGTAFLWLYPVPAGGHIRITGCAHPIV